MRASSAQNPGGLAHARAWLHARAQWLDLQQGLTAAQQAKVFLVCAVLVISRCPSLFYRAQFYAEDGMSWYSQAYNQGWLHALTLSDGGYLNSLQRLCTGPALLVPLRWAPLLMAVMGLGLQCLPVAVLLSRRCRAWGTLSFRALCAAIYLCLPNAREVHVNLTNSQWHFALAVMLLAFAAPPETSKGKVADVLLFLLSGFCGPYSVVLAPLVLVYWLVRRQAWSLVLVALMLVGDAVQLDVLAHSSTRMQGPLGVALAPFIRMIGGDIVTAAIFGGYPFARYVPLALLALAAAAGFLVWGYCLRFASLQLKLFTVYAGLLLGAALHSPMISGPLPRWQMLVNDYSGRYWFFPMLALLWGCAWCVFYAPQRVFRTGARWVLFAMLIGVVDNWEFKPYLDNHFAQSAARFRAAQPGTTVLIPIVPKDWVITLVKKDPAGRG